MTNTPLQEPLFLRRDSSGQFLLPAELLAKRFGWPVETLRTMMQRGLVASTVERGEGEDAGRWRLSVRCGNRRWQITLSQDGAVIAQRFEHIPLPKR